MEKLPIIEGATVNIQAFESIEQPAIARNLADGGPDLLVFLRLPEDRRRGWVRSEADPGALELIDVDQARKRRAREGKALFIYLDSERYPYA